MALANGFDFEDRLGAFTGEAKRSLAVFKPPHPALPRVMCPDCSRSMRLVRIGPSELPRRADINLFACSCGSTHSLTVDRID
jgi:hypothetical protein